MKERREVQPSKTVGANVREELVVDSEDLPDDEEEEEEVEYGDENAALIEES